MSAAAFNLALAFILPHEEDFARGHWGDERFVVAENVDGDSGGWTKYGIDQSSHPSVDVKNLTRAEAIGIYYAEWQRTGFEALPSKLAVALFDVEVNGGFPAAWLQNALNETKAPGTLLVVDNRLGPCTIASANHCDQDAVLMLFLAQRDERFKRLAQSPARAKFLSGWEQRDVDLATYLKVSAASSEGVSSVVA